jgi:hypothetical protein
MYCSKCSTENPEETQFCSKCGSPLKDVALYYAGFWRRVAAILIDGAILLFVSLKIKEGV